MPILARLVLKLLLIKPKVSRKTLPKVILPKIGVPVHKLAPIKITMPDAKNTKIATKIIVNVSILSTVIQPFERYI